MPRNKDLKRLVRARMRKTGESYTAARTQLTRKPKSPTTARAATAAPAVDHGAIAGMSNAVIRTKTGRSWAEWVEALDWHDAQTMAHRDIAALVSREYGIGDWWCQTVTVGYERLKGLRAIGQRRDGSYEASKSKTYGVPVTTLFNAWKRPATRRRWLDDVKLTLRTATAPKTMRFDFEDGSIVVIGFMPKGRSKSAVAVQHTKLPDAATGTRLKQFWTEKLEALGRLLESRVR